MSEVQIRVSINHQIDFLVVTAHYRNKTYSAATFKTTGFPVIPLIKIYMKILIDKYLKGLYEKKSN